MSSKEDGKDHELIQSSITPDPRYHMGKCKNSRKIHTHESQKVSPFPAGDHKASRSRRDRKIKTNVKQKSQIGTNLRGLGCGRYFAVAVCADPVCTS